MKKTLLFLLFFIVGCLMAQPPCNASCTTCPGIRVCVDCICQSPTLVELLYLKADFDGNKVIVSWGTASEANNDYFTVERSTDGLSFKTLSVVDGAGNSNDILHYSTVDTTPFEGISYYRLKQTDFSGVEEYSYIVVVSKEDISNSPLLIIYNLLGQEVDSTYRGVKFYMYSDKTVKRY